MVQVQMLLKCHKQFEGVIKKMGKTGLMKVRHTPPPAVGHVRCGQGCKKASCRSDACFGVGVGRVVVCV